MSDVVVSVIMPAYNCQNYIGKAIESVLKQNVPLELIVVNDNSTDSTGQIIGNYMDDERVRLLNNTDNLGAAKSRNMAVEAARGQYVAFLDADDYWTEDKLTKQIAFMQEHNAVLSSTARELMREDGTLSGTIISIPERITYKRLLEGNVLNTSGVVVDAEVAKRYPMVQEHLHEDYIMWLSILKDYGEAYGLNEPLLKYRVMTGTKSSNKLKSAKMTYGVYRYMGYGRLRSFYYFCWYAVRGFVKYIGFWQRK